MDAPLPRLTIRRLLLACTLLWLPACGGGDAPTGPSGPPPPPPNPDRDGDGILNSVDACPDQAEVFNGWQDDEGCPDDTLDFYAAVRNDIDVFWDSLYRELNATYRPISGFTAYSTPITYPCGETLLRNATYCRPDEGVYYHRLLLDSLLVVVGEAAPAVIIAHEIGHHIQKLEGILDLADLPFPLGPTGKQVELQADCLAGVWVADVAIRGFVSEEDWQDIGETLWRIGDDTLGGPWFNPDGHGTALQRTEAFLAGLLFGVAPCADVFQFPRFDVAGDDRLGDRRERQRSGPSAWRRPRS